MHDHGRIDPIRRRLVAAMALAPAAGLCGIGSRLAAAEAAEISAETAKKRLAAGNERFVAGKLRHRDLPRRREALVPGQKPFAIILGCADSRVPPELAFDQGLGDIFTVRVAGNIADDPGIGSMEYAVEHFGTPLIVVLGHQNCGAVAATIEAMKAGVTPPPHIASLVAALRPAVEAAKGTPGDLLENAIHANVRQTVAALKASQPVLAKAVAEHRLEIIGAEYQLESGRVRSV